MGNDLKKLTSIGVAFDPVVILHPSADPVHNTDTSKHNKKSDTQKPHVLTGLGWVTASSPTLIHQHPKMQSVTLMWSAQN